jgi:hypothetical protein
MFFFPMFWTVYIPILVAVLSLAPEWLMRSLRQLFAPVMGKSPSVAVIPGSVHPVTRTR